MCVCRFRCRLAFSSLSNRTVHHESNEVLFWFPHTGLHIQLGLSYQNFNRPVNNQTSAIKYENMEALCNILECTPNDLFYEYYRHGYGRCEAPDENERTENGEK